MSQPIVQVDNLSRLFGRKVALASVSLSVERGRVFGLVGENGAGKTTLIKHLLGMFRPQHGSVKVFGMDPIAHPVEVLGQIGYLSEDRDLPGWMRVHELLNYSQAFYPRWDADFAYELRRTFQLGHVDKISKLSRGQKARLGLLVALAHRPDLLILDEPSSGLDPVVRRDILAAIIRTVAEEGRTVIFSSHLLDEVQRVADDVAMIHEGNLVLCDPLEQVLDAHHRLTLRFEHPLSEAPKLAGAIACTGAGYEWTAVCNGELEQVRQAALSLGGEIVDEGGASLDEIFVARVKGATV